MIIVMKTGATEKQIQDVEKVLQELGFQTHPIYGAVKTVIGAIGDRRLVEAHRIDHMEAWRHCTHHEPIQAGG